MLIKIKALRSLSWTFFHSSPCVCTKEEGSLLSHVDELAKRKIWPHSKLFTDALASLVKRPLWAPCVIAGHTQSYTSLWEPYLMVYCSQDTVWLFTCPCPWPHSFFFFLPEATFPKPISPVSSYPYFKTQLQHHFLQAALFLIAPLSLARLGALCLYPHITGHFSRPECSLHCLIMVSPPPLTVWELLQMRDPSLLTSVFSGLNAVGWWLILCINLTRSSRYSDIWLNGISRCVCEGVSGWG